MSLSDAGRRYLRRRRIMRCVGAVAVGAVACAWLAQCHFGRAVDDWGKFDHRPFVVAAAMDDGSILVRSADGSTQQIVRLLGVDTRQTTNLPDYLRSRLVGKTVMLLLDSPQTRDGQRRLLAYVFSSDVDNLNVNVVHDGLAYADRRQNCLLNEEIRTAQNDARKKVRGLWDEAAKKGWF
jgi:endonuclease YncB( thermonuclease family)